MNGTHEWIGHKGMWGRNMRWTCEQLRAVICHCGHPTALRPYYIDGRLHELGTFRTLAQAKAAAEIAS